MATGMSRLPHDCNAASVRAHCHAWHWQQVGCRGPCSWGEGTDVVKSISVLDEATRGLDMRRIAPSQCRVSRVSHGRAHLIGACLFISLLILTLGLRFSVVEADFFRLVVRALGIVPLLLRVFHVITVHLNLLRVAHWSECVDLAVVVIVVVVVALLGLHPPSGPRGLQVSCSEEALRGFRSQWRGEQECQHGTEGETRH